jgi:hypothetical protein
MQLLWHGPGRCGSWFSGCVLMAAHRSHTHRIASCMLHADMTDSHQNSCWLHSSYGSTAHDSCEAADFVIGACGTGIDNIVVGGLRRQAKRGDRLRIAARNCGYETTISFNTRREDESNQTPCLRIQSDPAASKYS